MSPASDTAPVGAPPITHLSLLTLLAVAGISASPILVRYAQAADAGPITIAAGRLLLATLLTALSTVVGNRLSHRQDSERKPSQVDGTTRSDRRWLVLGSMALALHFSTWIASLAYVPVFVSVVLVTTSPLIMSVLEWLLLGQRLSRMTRLGLLIAVGGSTIVALGGQTASIVEGYPQFMLGVVLSLTGAFAVAVYWIIGRRLRRTMSLSQYTVRVYGVATVLLMGFLVLFARDQLSLSLEALGWIALIALLPQLMGHSIFNYLLKVVPATIVGVLTQLETIGSALLAYLLFSEIPGAGSLIGGTLVTGGVLLAILGQRHNTSTPQFADEVAASTDL